MGVLSKYMCQVYKLLFSDKIRTGSVTCLYETNPVPAIFYFIYFTISYGICLTFVYCIFGYFIECGIRLITDS